jgi:hypothetical protein
MRDGPEIPVLAGEELVEWKGPEAVGLAVEMQVD